MPIHHPTPMVESDGFGTPAQRVWLKLECLQPSGSFKLRGIGHACRDPCVTRRAPAAVVVGRQCRDCRGLCRPAAGPAGDGGGARVHRRTRQVADAPPGRRGQSSTAAAGWRPTNTGHAARVGGCVHPSLRRPAGLAGPCHDDRRGCGAGPAAGRGGAVGGRRRADVRRAAGHACRRLARRAAGGGGDRGRRFAQRGRGRGPAGDAGCHHQPGHHARRPPGVRRRPSSGRGGTRCMPPRSATTRRCTPAWTWPTSTG